MELESTGYIVVAWRSADPLDKDMVVLYFESARDMDVWFDAGNTAYKTTPVARLIPATFMR